MFTWFLRKQIAYADLLLNQIAAEHNAVYALVNGDQPRNLLDLWSWGKLLGLEIVAVGKSSEYDFVWDRETWRIYISGWKFFS